MKRKKKIFHAWDVSPAQARQIQNDLRDKIISHDSFDEIRTVAGVDVGFDKKTGTGKAAIVVLSIIDLKLIDSSIAEAPLLFPYVPGLLSFREVPVVLMALEKLNILPDILLCDGQGIAHPRRFGIACHLGILTDLPAIGVAKTRLIGDHTAVPEEKGRWANLIDKGEVIGAALRSRENVKPIYISVGHKISLKSSILIVMKALTKYKLPETTRKAHRLSLFYK